MSTTSLRAKIVERIAEAEKFKTGLEKNSEKIIIEGIKQELEQVLAELDKVIADIAQMGSLDDEFEFNGGYMIGREEILELLRGKSTGA